MAIGHEQTPHGSVAAYIPELAKAHRDALGICVTLPDGSVYREGDIGIRFTIQSISKVISLCKALEVRGMEEAFSRVGMEPSGEAFNSIEELDLQPNKPFNPMINSGVIAVESTIIDYVSFDVMLDYARKLCADPDITLNRQVYLSEMETCDRNCAIAYLLKSKGIITANVDNSIELYTKLSIMLTCGMYDGSGRFAAEVGVPTKSGVGGGLMAAVHGRAGISIYSPALDAKGNCVAGCEMMRYLSCELGLHMFQNCST